MERWRGRVAVVTGASAGIGAAIASQLQDAGLIVVALARREDKIPLAVEQARKDAKARGRSQVHKAATPGKLHCVKCDLSNEADILEAFKWIKNNVSRVDILVNNAGRVGRKFKLAEEAAAEDWRGLLNLNVLALSICTREAIQLMREKGIDDGHIIHIGSVLGHILPDSGGQAMYYASKHAVRVLTEGLRKELVAAKSKIRVSEVSPGLVETEIAGDKSFFEGKPHLWPEDLADPVLYVLSTPPHVQIHEMIVKPIGEPV